MKKPYTFSYWVVSEIQDDITKDLWNRWYEIVVVVTNQSTWEEYIWDTEKFSDRLDEMRFIYNQFNDEGTMPSDDPF